MPEDTKEERQTYFVLSEVQILDTIYPEGELVSLLEDQAEDLLASGQIEIWDEEKKFNEQSQAHPV